ncbi:TetR/AcrR family transcriptional regulator [Pseudovibrio sp. SPO723]|uniref:TetR/AcrR family transcriptional regulator n=1 Tax=Nesiotobacter zosterae TaxID=392721 RepID=UPI0029C189CB|nr:TetR/AcrR family transcriptional regulator [Pseudovibrio sp. SPO723]MDX5593871.1 TetR/AcrR family transcriptional regulator [Pseudovibrio sp. SPO723]
MPTGVKEAQNTAKGLQTREKIFDAAEQLILAKSFNGIGLSEILKASHIPKGSFYHYFASKEDFGARLIEHYAAQKGPQVHKQLFEAGGTARDRVLGIIKAEMEKTKSASFRISCLVVKLSGEIATTSEPMRTALEEASASWIKKYADVVRQGHLDGSMPSALDPDATGQVIHLGLSGAMMQASIQNSTEPYDAFMKTMERLTAA